ncbi:glycosyltransferase family 4 protein [Sphingobium yanoikuyae]|uniref:Glycosyltransferase n=1 Tax=Sphingobium yanoikuyae TaxID=13690 RepID=A0A3G2UPR3_SPHYA|nr:glycosyltransferase family 4 protein [Sphingobium yanoikuyae]AYO77217.1 glycosyltransferase [Sphingobium yanoikuyae]
MKRVSYIFPTSHHYRLPFHERLRELLAARGVDYTVIYCDPGEENVKKRDTVDIAWGQKVSCSRLPGGLVYQHGLRAALKCDLVIVQQENNLALNYLLNLASMVGVRQVAYFGHGRNFQSRAPNGSAERWKRFWATKVDWWFGYTNETRRHVEALGFSSERITVFNNAVDTSGVRALINAVTPARLVARRNELNIEGEHVGVFVGGLYADKRLAFLVDAADRIRARVRDFTLIVAGGGDQLPLMEELAATRPWIKVLGPRFGADKVELMLLAQLFLMPGLVGLGVVDAGAARLPTVTTAFPYHSPEIAYVENDVNGVIVNDWEDPQAYAEAVIELLKNPARLAEMRAAAERMAQDLTVESMSDRFAEGVFQALGV